MQVEALSDFSDRLSPVFVRELRQGLRAQHFIWSFILLQALALGCVLTEWIFVELVEDTGTFSSAGILLPASGIIFGLVLPLGLFGTLQTEVGSGSNIELLLTSRLTRWQIVLGKYYVGIILSTLLFVSILPYLMLRYFLVNADIVETLLTVGSLWLLNSVVTAIVIGASGFRNYVGRAFVIGSFAVTFSICALIVFGVSQIGGSSFGRVLSFGIPRTVLLCANQVICAFFFIVVGLQLGRSRLKLYEDPIAPPTTALIIILVYCMPMVFGFVHGLMGLILGFVAIGGVSFVALIIDRPPKPGKKAALFDQSRAVNN